MKIAQDTNHYNIGRNIRKYRVLKHMTQEQTVIRLQLLGINTSRGSYSHIECGIGNVKVEELIGLAQIFQVQITDFFEGIVLKQNA